MHICERAKWYIKTMSLYTVLSIHGFFFCFNGYLRFKRFFVGQPDYIALRMFSQYKNKYICIIVCRFAPLSHLSTPCIIIKSEHVRPTCSYIKSYIRLCIWAKKINVYRAVFRVGVGWHLRLTQPNKYCY